MNSLSHNRPPPVINFTRFQFSPPYAIIHTARAASAAIYTESGAMYRASYQKSSFTKTVKHQIPVDRQYRKPPTARFIKLKPTASAKDSAGFLSRITAESDRAGINRLQALTPAVKPSVTAVYRLPGWLAQSPMAITSGAVSRNSSIASASGVIPRASTTVSQ